MYYEEWRTTRLGETEEQRRWIHKLANILDALPKSIQPLVKKMPGALRDAEDRDMPAMPPPPGELRAKDRRRPRVIS